MSTCPLASTSMLGFWELQSIAGQGPYSQTWQLSPKVEKGSPKPDQGKLCFHFT